jgi:hypothetical protein
MFDYFDEQGWNDETKLTLCEHFIAESGLTDKFVTYLTKIADEENAENETPTGDSMFKLDKKQHDAMGAKIDEVVAFLRDAAEQGQSDHDDKSEKWQEGDAAAAAIDWIDKLTDAADNIENAWADVEISAK